MSDERLREAYRSGLDGGHGEPGDGCVGADELRALVERAGPEDERLRRLDHVMTCPSCLRDFEMLRAVNEAATARSDAEPHSDAAEARPDPTASEGAERRPDRSRVWFRPLALAASIAAVAGGVLLWQQSRPDPVVFREGSAPAPVGLEPLGLVDFPDRFVWSAVAADGVYELEVLGPEGSSAYRVSTNDTVHVPPDPVPLERGVEYRWIVQHRSLEHGVTVSGPTSFRVR